MKSYKRLTRLLGSPRVSKQPSCRLTSHRTYFCYIFFDATKPHLQKPTNLSKNPPSSAYLDHLGLIPQDPQVSDDKQKEKQKKKRYVSYFSFSTKEYMSRTYNFRTRTDAGIASQPGAPAAVFNRPRTMAARARDPPPHVPSSVHDTDPATALYSDVVASRPPSPRRERETEPTITRGVGDSRLNSDVPVFNTMPDSNNSSSDEEVPRERDDNNVPWTTVIRKHRRARSLGSLNEPRIRNGDEGDAMRRLTNEQARVVNAAKSKMTVQQKETLKRRQDKVNSPQSPEPSDGEGPSRDKGKGIDPREWGNVNFRDRKASCRERV